MWTIPIRSHKYSTHKNTAQMDLSNKHTAQKLQNIRWAALFGYDYEHWATNAGLLRVKAESCADRRSGLGSRNAELDPQRGGAPTSERTVKDAQGHALTTRIVARRAREHHVLRRETMTLPPPQSTRGGGQSGGGARVGGGREADYKL